MRRRRHRDLLPCALPLCPASLGGPGLPGLARLEHALLFMFKTRAEFGAKLWNGVYFQLTPTERGFEGWP